MGRGGRFPLNPDLTAIVLAGGKSSRFGSDKAAATLHGLTFLELVVGACRAVCSEVVVVLAPGQPPPPGTSPPATLVYDAVAHEGPLAGLISGLARVTTGWALVCSCDAPLLQPALLELLSQPRGPDIEAVLLEVQLRIQPFPSLVAASALPAIQQDFDNGERRIARSLERLRHTVIPEQVLRAVDPALLSFRNINTPQDLAVLAHERALNDVLLDPALPDASDV